MNKENYCNKVVSTKVTPLMYEKLKLFAESSELNTMYNFMQTLLFSFLRYVDKETDITNEMETLINIYEDVFMLSNNSKGINHNRVVSAKISDAIYFESGNGTTVKTAFRISANGESKKVSYNVREMVDLFLANINPKLYAKLQALQKILEFENLLDVVEYIADKYDIKNNCISEDVKELFKDNERIGFGNVSLEYETPGINNRHFSIDTAHCNRENKHEEN